MTEAYPLSWPQGWNRTRRPVRAAFSTNFVKARDGLFHEIELMGGRLPILSTNVPLRRDGLPYANRPEPDDRGVAVYFQYKDNSMCFASDRYDRVRDNVQAIRKTIEALRGIERWGASDMMERAFTGFAALPDPNSVTVRGWRDILEVGPDATLEDAEAQYLLLRSRHHPDRGGDPEMFHAVQKAIKQARGKLL